MIQETSLEAFRLHDHQVWGDAVLGLIMDRLEVGLTADEASAHFKVFHNTVAPTFTRLKNDRLIYDSGLRRKTRSGRSAIVWKFRAVQA